MFLQFFVKKFKTDFISFLDLHLLLRTQCRRFDQIRRLVWVLWSKSSLAIESSCIRRRRIRRSQKTDRRSSWNVDQMNRRLTKRLTLKVERRWKRNSTNLTKVRRRSVDLTMSTLEVDLTISTLEVDLTMSMLEVNQRLKKKLVILKIWCDIYQDKYANKKKKKILIFKVFKLFCVVNVIYEKKRKLNLNSDEEKKL